MKAKDVLKMLEDIEKEGWEEEIHCSCMRYAIYKIKEALNATETKEE